MHLHHKSLLPLTIKLRGIGGQHLEVKGCGVEDGWGGEVHVVVQRPGGVGHVHVRVCVNVRVGVGFGLCRKNSSRKIK